MKNLILSIALSLIAVPAMAADITGTYYDGALFSSTPATLKLTFSGSTVTAKIVAPGAPCVLSFATGRHMKTNRAVFGGITADFYALPTVQTCGGPRGFGAFRTLMVEKDHTGKVQGVKISGSSGKLGWTYFLSH